MSEAKTKDRRAIEKKICRLSSWPGTDLRVTERLEAKNFDVTRSTLAYNSHLGKRAISD